ncbi:hypothetical protein AMECASPLE_008245, partial [Ameca splendens]
GHSSQPHPPRTPKRVGSQNYHLVHKHKQVRTCPPTGWRKEATLSCTGVNPNVPTPAWRLSPRATPEWKSVQPLSGRLVPGPEPCIEASPIISSQNLSTSHTNSGSFPTREVTFHVPRASFCSRGSDRQPLPLHHGKVAAQGEDSVYCLALFFK